MTSNPAASFWDFSTAVYGRRGVAPACLALQDRRGLDVNLLLFCCWAGSRGRGLTEGEVRHLAAVAEPWLSAAVEPLRTLRRWLKRAEGVPAEAAASFRERVKALELEAERIEQRMFCDSVKIDPAPAAADPKIAAANLRAYLRFKGLRPEAQDTAALGMVLAGCFEELTSTEALRLLG